MTILDQPLQNARPLVYASFGERVVARLIDGFIVLIPSVFLPLFGPWLYFALQEGSESGATVGKKAMGIRVVSEEGRVIGFGTATGRFLGNLINLFTCLTGYLLMFFNARNQCLHDIITGTVVIKADSAPTAEAAPSVQSRPQKRSWSAKVGETETHFVEINAEGGRHWRRSATGEQINDFTLWQLTDGLVDLSAEFGQDAYQEMKAYAEQILRSKA